MMTADKLRFILSEQERGLVLQEFNKGAKAVFVQDSLISLAIAPTITEYERWFAQENERLFERGKRLCKKCGSIMDVGFGCICWGKHGEYKSEPIRSSEVPDALLEKIGNEKLLTKNNASKQLE